MTTLQTIPLDELEDGMIVLVDLRTVPPQMAVDYSRRNENIASKKQLCPSCDGTGNGFFSMYRQCQKCLGTGVVQQKEMAGMK